MCDPSIIQEFLDQFWRDRHSQITQAIPGAEICVPSGDGWQPLYAPPGEALYDGPAGQEWRLMARAAAGDLEADEDLRGEVYATCQKWAEWLFAAPGLGYSYSIPDQWYESPAGAIWAAALVWSQGDELITIADAARLAGVSIKTIASRVDRRKLRSFVDPNADKHQGRRLVRKRDVEAYAERKKR